MRLFLVFSLILLKSVDSFGDTQEQEAANFQIIQGFFLHSFPQSFTASIQSPVIDRDIQKIPKIYIMDNTKKPVLRVLFSRPFGIKIFMDNVARGISKQYNKISEGFSIFTPFWRDRSFEDFSEQYSLTSYHQTNQFFLSEKNHDNSKSGYIIDIGKLGQILKVVRLEGGKSTGAVVFEYKRENSFTILSQIETLDFRKGTHDYFIISDYDVSPKLRQEDFLG